jgi:TonB dependent receptor
MKFPHIRLRNLLALGVMLPALGVAQTAADDTTTLPEVDVVAHLDEARNQIQPSLGATSYEILHTQIEQQAQGADAPFNETLLRAPGVVQDSFGQLHVRGEHANLQYRIDGVLLPEGITGFGQELDSRFVDKLSLIDGALPAQFGFKTAGIVDIQTKSGALAPGGDVNFYGGSFDTIRPSFEYGGADGKLSYYFSGSFLRSDLGIENPTSSDRAIHDITNQYRGFMYLSYVIDPTSRISLFGGSSYGDYQIPNNPGQTPAFDDKGITTFDSSRLNENQHQQNDYGVLAYQKTLDDFSFQVSLFERYSSVLFTPDPVGDMIFNGVAGRVDQSLLTHGLEFDSSYKLNDQHTIRGGFTVTLASQMANDPMTVFHTNAAGAQSSNIPFTIDQGDYKLGWLYGFYLQDEWKVFSPLTINYGGRFDIVDEFTHQNQFQPRINLTLQATRSTVVHAGYAQYFTPPSFEAVSQTDVAKTVGTTNAFEVQKDDPVRAERSNYFDVGVNQTVFSGFHVGLDCYYKQAHNQIDSGQFGAAVIETEFNYREGLVYGAELTASYEHEGFSSYGNLALSRAEGKDIDSQQFQFGAEELAYIKNHWIYLDHNQAVTASAGISYKWKNSRVSVDFLYGNGLRAGFANEEKLSPYYPINLGFEQAVSLPHLGKFKVRLDVVNLFDQVYELRAGTGVGVGAPQYGMRRGIFGGLSFDF